MKKIRIMHVAQAAGGVDKYIQMLLKYINHDKFENIMVCSYDFKQEDYIGLADIFEQVNMHRAIGLTDIAAMGNVKRLIMKYKPDIVYAHSSKAGAIARVANIGMKNALGQKNICIYNPHGWAFNIRCSRQKQMFYSEIEKIAAVFCDKIICISDSEKKSALDKKICKEKQLQVIFNGVDIDNYEVRKKSGANDVTRALVGIPSDAFVIGMVGRISAQKAPDIFINVAKQVKKRIDNAYFIIVGDGDQRKQIEKYAESIGLSDSLLITGWVKNALDYVDLFDVAVLLSRWEGFGLALPEYMLAGKPIVATRVDAIPNIISDGENGLLVEVDDVLGASNAIIRLHKDTDLRLNLISRGRLTVYDKYNARRVSKEHELLFEKLINERS